MQNLASVAKPAHSEEFDRLEPEPTPIVCPSEPFLDHLVPSSGVIPQIVALPKTHSIVNAITFAPPISGYQFSRCEEQVVQMRTVKKAVGSLTFQLGSRFKTTCEGVVQPPTRAEQHRRRTSSLGGNTAVAAAARARAVAGIGRRRGVERPNTRSIHHPHNSLEATNTPPLHTRRRVPEETVRNGRKEEEGRRRGEEGEGGGPHESDHVENDAGKHHKRYDDECDNDDDEEASFAEERVASSAFPKPETLSIRTPGTATTNTVKRGSNDESNVTSAAAGGDVPRRLQLSSGDRPLPPALLTPNKATGDRRVAEGVVGKGPNDGVLAVVGPTAAVSSLLTAAAPSPILPPPPSSIDASPGRVLSDYLTQPQSAPYTKALSAANNSTSALEYAKAKELVASPLLTEAREGYDRIIDGVANAAKFITTQLLFLPWQHRRPVDSDFEEAFVRSQKLSEWEEQVIENILVTTTRTSTTTMKTTMSATATTAEDGTAAEGGGDGSGDRNGKQDKAKRRLLSLVRKGVDEKAFFDPLLGDPLRLRMTTLGGGGSGLKNPIRFFLDATSMLTGAGSRALAKSLTRSCCGGGRGRSGVEAKKTQSLLSSSSPITTSSLKSSCPIPCMLIRNPKAKFLVIAFHANASDIGYTSDRGFFFSMSCFLPASILLVEYPGYGLHSGEASENAVKRTAETVVQYVFSSSTNLSPRQILIYGVSIGTGVAVHTANIITRACAEWEKDALVKNALWREEEQKRQQRAAMDARKKGHDGFVGGGDSVGVEFEEELRSSPPTTAAAPKTNSSHSPTNSLSEHPSGPQLHPPQNPRNNSQPLSSTSPPIAIIGGYSNDRSNSPLQPYNGERVRRGGGGGAQIKTENVSAPRQTFSSGAVAANAPRISSTCFHSPPHQNGLHATQNSSSSYSASASASSSVFTKIPPRWWLQLGGIILVSPYCSVAEIPRLELTVPSSSSAESARRRRLAKLKHGKRDLVAEAEEEEKRKEAERKHRKKRKFRRQQKCAAAAAAARRQREAEENGATEQQLGDNSRKGGAVSGSKEEREEVRRQTTSAFEKESSDESHESSSSISSSPRRSSKGSKSTPTTATTSDSTSDEETEETSPSLGVLTTPTAADEMVSPTMRWKQNMLRPPWLSKALEDKKEEEKRRHRSEKMRVAALQQQQREEEQDRQRRGDNTHDTENQGGGGFGLLRRTSSSLMRRKAATRTRSKSNSSSGDNNNNDSTGGDANNNNYAIISRITDVAGLGTDALEDFASPLVVRPPVSTALGAAMEKAVGGIDYEDDFAAAAEAEDNEEEEERVDVNYATGGEEEEGGHNINNTNNKRSSFGRELISSPAGINNGGNRTSSSSAATSAASASARARQQGDTRQRIKEHIDSIDIEKIRREAKQRQKQRLLRDNWRFYEKQFDKFGNTVLYGQVVRLTALKTLDEEYGAELIDGEEDFFQVLAKEEEEDRMFMAAINESLEERQAGADPALQGGIDSQQHEQMLTARANLINSYGGSGNINTNNNNNNNTTIPSSSSFAAAAEQQGNNTNSHLMMHRTNSLRALHRVSVADQMDRASSAAAALVVLPSISSDGQGGSSRTNNVPLPLPLLPPFSAENATGGQEQQLRQTALGSSFHEARWGLTPRRGGGGGGSFAASGSSKKKGNNNSGFAFTSADRRDAAARTMPINRAREEEDGNTMHTATVNMGPSSDEQKSKEKKKKRKSKGSKQKERAKKGIELDPQAAAAAAAAQQEEAEDERVIYGPFGKFPLRHFMLNRFNTAKTLCEMQRDLQCFSTLTTLTIDCFLNPDYLAALSPCASTSTATAAKTGPTTSSLKKSSAAIQQVPSSSSASLWPRHVPNTNTRSRSPPLSGGCDEDDDDYDRGGGAQPNLRTHTGTAAAVSTASANQRRSGGPLLSAASSQFMTPSHSLSLPRDRRGAKQLSFNLPEPNEQLPSVATMPNLGVHQQQQQLDQQQQQEQQQQEEEEHDEQVARAVPLLSGTWNGGAALGEGGSGRPFFLSDDSAAAAFTFPSSSHHHHHNLQHSLLYTREPDTNNSTLYLGGGGEGINSNNNPPSADLVLFTEANALGEDSSQQEEEKRRREVARYHLHHRAQTTRESDNNYNKYNAKNTKRDQYVGSPDTGTRRNIRDERVGAASLLSSPLVTNNNTNGNNDASFPNNVGSSADAASAHTAMLMMMMMSSTSQLHRAHPIVYKARVSVESVGIPILLLHGKNDETIMCEHSFEILTRVSVAHREWEELVIQEQKREAIAAEARWKSFFSSNTFTRSFDDTNNDASDGASVAARGQPPRKPQEIKQKEGRTIKGLHEFNIVTEAAKTEIDKNICKHNVLLANRNVSSSSDINSQFDELELTNLGKRLFIAPSSSSSSLSCPLSGPTTSTSTCAIDMGDGSRESTDDAQLMSGGGRGEGFRVANPFLTPPITNNVKRTKVDVDVVMTAESNSGITTSDGPSSLRVPPRIGPTLSTIRRREDNNGSLIETVEHHVRDAIEKHFNCDDVSDHAAHNKESNSKNDQKHQKIDIEEALRAATITKQLVSSANLCIFLHPFADHNSMGDIDVDIFEWFFNGGRLMTFSDALEIPLEKEVRRIRRIWKEELVYKRRKLRAENLNIPRHRRQRGPTTPGAGAATAATAASSPAMLEIALQAYLLPKPSECARLVLSPPSALVRKNRRQKAFEIARRIVSSSPNLMMWKKRKRGGRGNEAGATATCTAASATNFFTVGNGTDTTMAGTFTSSDLHSTPSAISSSSISFSLNPTTAGASGSELISSNVKDNSARRGAYPKRTKDMMGPNSNNAINIHNKPKYGHGYGPTSFGAPLASSNKPKTQNAPFCGGGSSSSAAAAWNASAATNNADDDDDDDGLLGGYDTGCCDDVEAEEPCAGGGGKDLCTVNTANGVNMNTNNAAVPAAGGAAVGLGQRRGSCRCPTCLSAADAWNAYAYARHNPLRHSYYVQASALGLVEVCGVDETYEVAGRRTAEKQKQTKQGNASSGGNGDKGNNNNTKNNNNYARSYLTPSVVAAKCVGKRVIADGLFALANVTDDVMLMKDLKEEEEKEALLSHEESEDGENEDKNTREKNRLRSNTIRAQLFESAILEQRSSSSSPSSSSSSPSDSDDEDDENDQEEEEESRVVVSPPPRPRRGVRAEMVRGAQRDGRGGGTSDTVQQQDQRALEAQHYHNANGDSKEPVGGRREREEGDHSLMTNEDSDGEDEIARLDSPNVPLEHDDESLLLSLVDSREERVTEREEEQEPLVEMPSAKKARIDGNNDEANNNSGEEHHIDGAMAATDEIAKSVFSGADGAPTNSKSKSTSNTEEKRKRDVEAGEGKGLASDTTAAATALTVPHGKAATRKTTRATSSASITTHEQETQPHQTTAFPVEKVANAGRTTLAKRRPPNIPPPPRHAIAKNSQKVNPFNIGGLLVAKIREASYVPPTSSLRFMGGDQQNVWEQSFDLKKTATNPNLTTPSSFTAAQNLLSFVPKTNLPQRIGYTKVAARFMKKQHDKHSRRIRIAVMSFIALTGIAITLLLSLYVSNAFAYADFVSKLFQSPGVTGVADHTSLYSRAAQKSFITSVRSPLRIESADFFLSLTPQQQSPGNTIQITNFSNATVDSDGRHIIVNQYQIATPLASGGSPADDGYAAVAAYFASEGIANESVFLQSVDFSTCTWGGVSDGSATTTSQGLTSKSFLKKVAGDVRTGRRVNSKNKKKKGSTNKKASTLLRPLVLTWFSGEIVAMIGIALMILLGSKYGFAHLHRNKNNDVSEIVIILYFVSRIFFYFLFVFGIGMVMGPVLAFSSSVAGGKHGLPWNEQGRRRVWRDTTAQALRRSHTSLGFDDGQWFAEPSSTPTPTPTPSGGTVSEEAINDKAKVVGVAAIIPASGGGGGGAFECILGIAATSNPSQPVRDASFAPPSTVLYITAALDPRQIAAFMVDDSQEEDEISSHRGIVSPNELVGGEVSLFSGGSSGGDSFAAWMEDRSENKPTVGNKGFLIVVKKDNPIVGERDFFDQYEGGGLGGGNSTAYPPRKNRFKKWFPPEEWFGRMSQSQGDRLWQQYSMRYLLWAVEVPRYTMIVCFGLHTLHLVLSLITNK